MVRLLRGSKSTTLRPRSRAASQTCQASLDFTTPCVDTSSVGGRRGGTIVCSGMRWTKHSLRSVSQLQVSSFYFRILFTDFSSSDKEQEGLCLLVPGR